MLRSFMPDNERKRISSRITAGKLQLRCACVCVCACVANVLNVKLLLELLLPQLPPSQQLRAASDWAWLCVGVNCRTVALLLRSPSSYRYCMYYCCTGLATIECMYVAHGKIYSCGILLYAAHVAMVTCIFSLLPSSTNAQ